MRAGCHLAYNPIIQFNITKCKNKNDIDVENKAEFSCIHLHVHGNYLENALVLHDCCKQTLLGL